METITFKTPDGDLLRQRAAAVNATVSEFMRDLVAKLRPKQRSRIVKKNGFLVVELPPGCRPITDADLDAEEEEYIQNL